MKKTLLTLGLAFTAWMAQGQVSTYVLQPADLVGALDFTIGDNWGMVPDMNDPANLVQAYAAMVDDGTEADSLGCNALVNGADIAGKIAIVYRGVCEFGSKALNAQNAGAVAVVIVNNIPGAPVGMAAGADGAMVTIPVVMISQDAGASLHDAVLAGTVELQIGSVLGLFPNNLSMSKTDVLIPSSAARPSLVCADATEYSVALGAWVHNFGSDVQSDVTLQATVDHAGSSVYDESSDPATIPVGDSLFFTLPLFTQPGYDGRYDFTYTVNYGSTDDFPSDNTYTTSFDADSLYSLSPIDPTTGFPDQSNFIRPADAIQVYQVCSQFMDPHASRMRVEGIYAAATINAPATMVGQQLETRLFEWNDAVTGTTDAAFTDVSEVMNGEFQYTDSLQGSEVIYIPYFEPVLLQDNQRYLFCVSTSDGGVFLGHTTAVNYDQNNLESDQLSTILNLDDAWSVAGWVDGSVPALAVKMASATVGINEHNMVELTPYPNPTSTYVTIPTKGLSGSAVVSIFNLKGEKVSDQQVNVSGNNSLNVDLKSLSSGSYLFHLDFTSGQHSDFHVVVTK